MNKNPAKISNKKYKQGYYKVKNTDKCLNKGEYVIYRSSWEKTAMIYCDITDEVINWGTEVVQIPYISPIDNKPHRYFMDLLIEAKQKDGSSKVFLVEIKPNKETKLPRRSKNTNTYNKQLATYAVNQEKWKQAKLLCDKNGWSFLIWGENELLNKRKKR